MTIYILYDIKSTKVEFASTGDANVCIQIGEGRKKKCIWLNYKTAKRFSQHIAECVKDCEELLNS